MKQNVIDDYNVLSGQQKAAVLMLSLDEERSSALFSMMDDEEIKELSVIMASLGKVNSNVVEQLVLEFNLLPRRKKYGKENHCGDVSFFYDFGYM